MSTAQVYEIAFRLGGSIDGSLRNAFSNARRNLSDMGDQSEGAGKSMKILGAAAAATAAGIAAVATGLGAAIKVTDEFNSSMKQVQVATGLSTTQMKEMKEMSKNLYNQNLGEDWNDLAEAISTTKSVTGLAGKELEKATSNAIVYRDVWGEEVSQSVKAADTMMRNFGITSDQAYNLLAQGAQKGLNKSDELIDSANEYAPYFKSLGFNANQMFDTFSAGLAKGAFNLDKVGDAVKEFNIRAKDGSDASKEAFQALGMDAAKMSQIFAKGGPQAQKSFREVVQAISAIKDPVKKNEIGVALMGTQFEDLEKDVVAAMGTARSQFDMTKQTMEQIKNIKYDSFGMALQGIARQVETGLLIPIGEKLLPVLTSFSKSFAMAMPTIKKVAAETFGGIGNVMSSVADKIGPAFSKIPSIFRNVLTVAKPIIDQFVSFAKNIGSQLISFWQTDGAQIVQAVKNVFAGIGAIVRALAPVVLFIINMVWTNVKGVIQGALNIIMGLVRIFSGLFTGDFAKMWQGVKQLFIGAVQFIWNYLNLLFVGRILGGIKALATGAITRVGGMWTSVKSLFSGGVNNVWTQVVSMGTKIRQGFTTAKNAATSLAGQMWQGVKRHFNDIVSGATSLPGKIAAGISKMAGKAVSGITKMGNKMLRAMGKMINGVIDGLNAIMKKLSIDTVINSWPVPQYAKGTSGHKGGLAILGDGGGPELFRTPQGQMGLSPGTDTLMNLPKGTQVIPARETSQLMGMYNIPAYKKGNVLGNAFETGKEWIQDAGGAIKETATKAKDIAFDVFSYLSDPSQLLDKVLTNFGVGVPQINGPLGTVASSAFSFIKDKALNYLNGKLPQMVEGPGFGGAFRRTSNFGRRFHPVDKVWKNHNGIDYAAPVGTPIPSQTAGNVIFSGWRGGYGNAVMVNAGGGYTHLYGHNSKNLVKAGQSVSPGTILGLVGSTGKSTGPHVHYEVRHNGTPVNPDGVGGSLGGFGNFKGGGAAMARTAITQALRMLGKPMSLLNPLMTIAQKESGFNPNAINNWDINARRGDPSVGLFQIINSTFKRWMYPGHGNRRNPLHSALAAIRYMDGRYGGIMNHPGIKSMMKGGKYKPYYKGGRVGYNQWALVGERGPELLRLPGGSQVFNNGDSKSMLSGLLSFNRGTANGSPSITQTGPTQADQYIYSPQVIIQGNADEAVIEKANLNAFEMFKQWVREREEEKRRKEQLTFQ
ncbi:peptidoglycan DD-metalloendopeptidase family protein [Bacillus badius]|uniref:peptidoglycan DD-metalloendopeptidase family protein n=1 Tax=Bacillus badius TaxID=1455 RepID=UPI001CBF1DB2|nr:peptidoglycan DD-metalloendopeptidase family protein [Bacillus badius]UAT29503.1 peptidoglycan DD-metalloendopeptidase family protein [Bacillus badius]